MGFDGATVFGVGLIVGGLGLMASAVVGLGHRYHLFDGGRRRPVAPQRTPVRPQRTPIRPQGTDRRDAVRSNNNLGRTNSGRPPMRLRAGDSRLPGNDRPPPRRPGPPPVRPDAATAETVLLHPVPAWSTPGPPRNDPPRWDLRPTLAAGEVTRVIAGEVPPPAG